MEGFKEGGSISRPPLFDGSNYAYWKTKMTAFLRSIDSKTWKAVRAGWTAQLLQTTMWNSDGTDVDTSTVDKSF
ncbi:hypothetical protein LIER_34522 [Lithospermum erythrorhizon]|uniref:Gag-pol polyprotein n=1 Tax=Lithospermum erythrorhizon TaxID=34254 RepID=A0AAV3S342_LITER